MPTSCRLQFERQMRKADHLESFLPYTGQEALRMDSDTLLLAAKTATVTPNGAEVMPNGMTPAVRSAWASSTPHLKWDPNIAGRAELSLPALALCMDLTHSISEPGTARRGTDLALRIGACHSASEDGTDRRDPSPECAGPDHSPSLSTIRCADLAPYAVDHSPSDWSPTSLAAD